MVRDTLEQTLNDLHEQLSELDSFDAADRERLQQAVQEIQQSLDKQEVSSASLAVQLQEASSRFQESHPTLTNTVGRVADMLAQMGI